MVATVKALERLYAADPCLCVLVILYSACKTDHEPSVRQGLDFFHSHHERCGRCWENVLIRSQKAASPEERALCLDLVLLCPLEVERFLGGCYEVHENEERWHIRIKHRSDHSELWDGMELFLSKSRATDSWLLLDVSGDIDDERLKQRICELQTGHVQTFEDGGGLTIQWWALVHDQPVQLKIRRLGKIRTIEREWSLHGMFRDLVRKSMHRQKLLDSNDLADPRSTIALEVDQVRSLALQYDGRSRFAGFVDTTVGYRMIDRQRKQGKDPLYEAVRPGPVERDGDSASLAEETPPWDAEVGKRWGEEASEAFVAAELHHIMSRLTERQIQIVTMKEHEKLTDQEIAERLGVVRATVIRERRRVEKIAAGVPLPQRRGKA